MNVNFETIEKAWFKPKKTVLDELEEWLKMLSNKKFERWEYFANKTEIKKSKLIDDALNRLDIQIDCIDEIIEKIQELKKENENDK